MNFTHSVKSLGQSIFVKYTYGTLVWISPLDRAPGHFGQGIKLIKLILVGFDVRSTPAVQRNLFIISSPWPGLWQVHKHYGIPHVTCLPLCKTIGRQAYGEYVRYFQRVPERIECSISEYFNIFFLF